MVERPSSRVPPVRSLALVSGSFVVGLTAVALFAGDGPPPAEPPAVAPQVEPVPVAVSTTTVPPAPADLDEGCQVSAQVTSAGQPLDDVTLSLHLVNAQGTDATWTAAPRAEGVHRFVGLPKGSYHLVAQREGTAPQTAPPWRCEHGDERAFFALELPAGGAVLDGRVTGRGDRWVEGTEVLLEQPDGHRAAFPGVLHVPVDGDGRFTVKLLPGRYTLLALAPHHTPRVQELTIDDDGGRTRIQLAWRPEARGVVYDERGAPVANAQVFLGAAFDPKVKNSVVETGADGSFVLPVLPGREVVISARGDAGFGMTRLPEVSALEGHTNVVVQLAKGRTVGGWIEHRDGRPCAFCEVSYRVKSHGIAGTVKAGDDGTFTLAGMPLAADVELWPRDGAIGAWAGQVATPERSRVLLTFVPPAY